MEKILITGGAGYIGSVLTKKLLEIGYDVTVLDNFMFNQQSLLDCCLFNSFNIVRGDCRDKALLKELIVKADTIIPLAALVGAPLCNNDPFAAETTNLEAIKKLCMLTDKSQRIIAPNTNSGYGIGDKDKYCNEESPLKPISYYGKLKVEAEKIILDRDNSIGFRLATVFGMSPRMRIDLLVNDFTYRAIHDKCVILYEGKFRRNFIHIQDVVRVFIHALENFIIMKSKTYNVGLDNANYSKIELCNVIQKHIPNFKYFEGPIGEDPDKRDYIVSNKRITSTGFYPLWTLDLGIQEMIKGFTILRNRKYTNV